MSDLACWRLGIDEDLQVVVRIFGCELRMTDDEAIELADHIYTVVNGKQLESLGEAYAEIEDEVPSVRVDLASLLGLVKRDLPRRRMP